MRQGRRAMRGLERVRPFWNLAVGFVLMVTGCQTAAPLSQSTGVARAAFGLDPVALTDALANKPNRNWQDDLLNYPPLLDKERAKASRHLLGTGSIPWSYNLGTASSNAPAYAKPDVNQAGPSPAANDLLYVLTDNAKVVKLNPSTGAVLATSAAGALPGSYVKSAIAVSGDNKRLYAISTTGSFTILDASTLTQLWTASISSKGFSGMAPYIDYGSNTSGGNTIFGSIENVYAVATDGSIYHLLVDQSTGTVSVTVNACPSSSGTDVGSPKGAWNSNATLSLPATTVSDFPIVWKSHVYFGSTSGSFYDVDVSNTGAPTVSHSWDLTKYTTATSNGRSITAPAALDFDSSFNVSAIFVPCGDRLDWIDPVANTVTSSASLTLDHSAALGAPASPANPVAGALSGYTPAQTSIKSYNPDWISIKNLQLPNPSRWGGPLPTLGGNVAATSVRIDSSGNIWVCNYSASNVTIYHANGSAPTVVSVSANPTKLEFDGLGNCWVSCSGFATNGGSGWVEKISPAGVRQGGSFPVNFKGAVYIAPDSNGYCWVTDPYGGRVDCITPTGSLAFTSPISLATAAAIFVDPNNIAWVSAYGAPTVYRYALPSGPYPCTKPAATSSVNTGGSTPFGIAYRTSVTPPEAWVCLNGSSKICVMNMNTGAVLRTLPTSGSAPPNPWAIRFDSAGNPWTSNSTLSSTTTQSVTELNTSGNVIATYSMASYGNPYELVMDSTDTVYVACSSTNFSTGALVNIPNIGNTGDIFGTAYRGTSGDNDGSYGYVQFPITANAFANLPTVSAKVTLTQANTLTSADNLSIYTASNYQGGSTSTQWVGYNGTPNVDYNDPPTVASNPFATASNVNPGLNSPYSFSVPPPADQPNVTGNNANAYYSYAVQSTNKALRYAIHWYSKTTYGGTTAYLPTLAVTLDSYAQLPTANGIQCQPSVDSSNKKVYIAASNALFALDYSSTATYGLPSNTYYNFTQAGGTSGYGPVNTGTAPKTYLNPVGNVLMSLGGRAVIPDYNPSTSQVYLNNFDTTMSATSNRLVTTVDITPGKGSVQTQMLYDYELGSAYVVTSNNYVIRAQIMQ